MNLFDSIKSPFIDNNTLIKLIDIYSGMDEGDSSLYSHIVEDSERQEFDIDKYRRDFEELILGPSLDELYKNMRSQLKEGEKYGAMDSSVWRAVFDECSTYAELQEKISNAIKSKSVQNEILSMAHEFNGEDFDEEWESDYWESARENLTKETGYPKKELKETVRTIIPFLRAQEWLLSHFNARFNDKMGFHVNADTVMDCNYECQKNEIKFYINAGNDTCKVAALFSGKCKDRNLNYCFKVANPYKEEERRKDKLCIYSSLKDAQSFFEILQEIKNEHPELSFEEPPILTGRAEGWIGVGSDYKDRVNGRNTTYNVIMSNIVTKAIKNVFLGIDKKDIPGKIKDNSDLMGILKKEIIRMAKSYGYSKEKICVRKRDKRVLKRGGKYSLFGKIKGMFSKSEKLPSLTVNHEEKRSDFIDRIKISADTSKSNVIGEKTTQTEIKTPNVRKEPDHDNDNGLR
ncbi:MAG: hypothetical protein IJ890_03610 [Clostridia bacterium]|nr:hypothetical protein [Clostridia bacterium]